MKTVKKRSEGTGNPPCYQLPDINMIITQHLLMQELGINYASYRDLMAIHNNYRTHGTGLKVHAMLRMFSMADTNYSVIFGRLNVLRNKGLIYMMGSYWYPTEKAITILTEYKAL